MNIQEPEEVTVEVEKTVLVEAKVQTIYYQAADGSLNTFHHVSNTRLSNEKAEEVLEESGIEVVLLLRTLTERAILRIPEDDFKNFIVSTEKFYTQKN